jgi:hypothetical protein
LLIGLSRSVNDATDYFQIPTGQVVELGTQVKIWRKPVSSVWVVARRQQLHCFLRASEHLTPHASRFGSVS